MAVDGKLMLLLTLELNRGYANTRVTKAPVTSHLYFQQKVPQYRTIVINVEYEVGGGGGVRILADLAWVTLIALGLLHRLLARQYEGLLLDRGQKFTTL
jgi:hypothetical protein